MKTKLITLLIAIFALVGSATAQRKIQVYKDGEVVYSEYVSNIDSVKFIEHEYVDLGLSVKWATCNVGATTPEESGYYFAWGETESKTTYDWNTYKYCNGTSTSKTKYCTSSDYGIVDNKIILELRDDAAHVNWGGNWRMPTRAEQDELRDATNCTWEWTTQNGVNGYKIISKKNGNSIFLPAVGYYDTETLYSAGVAGRYWSSSLNTVNNRSYDLYFSLNSVDWFDYSCYGGLPIRAVCGDALIYTVSVSSSGETSGTATLSSNIVKHGGTTTLTATPNNNYVFKHWLLNGNVVSTQNPYTAIVTANSEYVAVFEIPTHNGYEYVDLGLSVKWATCNVGAESPEDYGDYFAWGETEAKEYYEWSSYKHCEGTSTSLTKYCTSLNYGIVDDNKTKLELEDDAAHVNWGGSWRMPTDSELEDLIDYCTWEWISQNGIYGYKATSKINGNFIFLPAAGSISAYDLRSDGWDSVYWSSKLPAARNESAYYLLLYPEVQSISYGFRCYGRSVRAVWE